MYTRWLDAATEYFGQTVMGIDGRLVFKGPRVAAAIHRGPDYDIMPIASYHPTAGACPAAAHSPSQQSDTCAVLVVNVLSDPAQTNAATCVPY